MPTITTIGPTTSRISSQPPWWATIWASADIPGSVEPAGSAVVRNESPGPLIE
jgi:hypothetical protein